MPYSYNPYDPEEIRRRQAFEEAANVDDVGGASAVLNDGPDEEPDNDVDDQPGLAASTGGAVPQTAADKFRQTLASAPNRADYQPSKLRRFGAALAGGLAGMRDAKTGVEVASGIRDQRFNQAQQDWASNVNRNALEMGLEKDQNAQDVARQRAKAYQQSADARTRAAAATEAWRRTQEANLPWTPKTEEQATRFEASKHPGPRPTAFDQYMSDPEGYAKYLKDVNAGKTQPLTFEQRKQLQDNATQGRLKVVGAQIAGRAASQRAAKPIMASPVDQTRAEQIAMEQLLRTNPEYQQFVIPGDPKTRVPARPMHASEIPQKTEGGLFGFGGTKVTDEPTRLKHQQFLMDLERAKRKVLGTQRVAGDTGMDDDNVWDLQDEEDDQ